MRRFTSNKKTLEATCLQCLHTHFFHSTKNTKIKKAKKASKLKLAEQPLRKFMGLQCPYVSMSKNLQLIIWTQLSISVWQHNRERVKVDPSHRIVTWKWSKDKVKYSQRRTCRGILWIHESLNLLLRCLILGLEWER